MSFDPYQTWLGIPAEEQPPNHYRLIGLEPFESDAARIHEAALATIARLRAFQAGVHADLCQQLMNQVSQARLTLIDPALKSSYDFELELTLRTQGMVAPTIAGKSGKRRLATVLGGILLVVLLLVGVAVNAPFGPDRNQNEQPVAAATQPGKESAGTARSSKETLPSDRDPVATTGVSMAVVPGLATLLNEDFGPAGPKGRRGICFFGFQVPPERTENQRATIEVEPGQTKGMFLPIPRGPSRFLVQFDGVELGKSTVIHAGVFQQPQLMVGIELTGNEQVLEARFRQPGDRRTMKSVRSREGRFFLDLRADGTAGGTGSTSSWRLFLGDSRSALAELGAAALDDPAAFGILVANTDQSPIRFGLDFLRIDGKKTDEFDRQRESWPDRPPLPAGDLLIDRYGVLPAVGADGDLSLKYRFLEEREAAFWTAEPAPGFGVKLTPGRPIVFPDIAAASRIQFTARFPEAAGSIEWRLGESTVILDAAKKSVVLGTAPAGEFPFLPRATYDCQIETPAANQIVLKIADQIWTADGVARTVGGLSATARGPGQIELQAVAIDARIDLLGAWLARVREDRRTAPRSGSRDASVARRERDSKTADPDSKKLQAKSAPMVETPMKSTPANELVTAADKAKGAGKPISSPRKPAQEKDAAGLPIGPQITHWMVLGPLPRPKESPRATTDDLGRFLDGIKFDKTPKAGDEELGLVWQASKEFRPTTTGAYLLSVPLDVQRRGELVVEVQSVPGSFICWFDGQEVVSRKVAGKNNAGSGGEPIRGSTRPLFRGRHRLFFVIDVADLQAPLVVRILDPKTLMPADELFHVREF